MFSSHVSLLPFKFTIFNRLSCRNGLMFNVIRRLLERFMDLRLGIRWNNDAYKWVIWEFWRSSFCKDKKRNSVPTLCHPFGDRQTSNDRLFSITEFLKSINLFSDKSNVIRRLTFSIILLSNDSSRLFDNVRCSNFFNFENVSMSIVWMELFDKLSVCKYLRS